jgi:hypothetical protein
MTKKSGEARPAVVSEPRAPKPGPPKSGPQVFPPQKGKLPRPQLLSRVKKNIRQVFIEGQLAVKARQPAPSERLRAGFRPPEPRRAPK